MIVNRIICSCYISNLIPVIFLFSFEDNPADELVAAVNSNRTGHKSSSLFANPGLGCVALEYIKAYKGQCGDVGGNMRPPNSSFTEIFAPDCGIDAKSLGPITGRLIACQTKYVKPDEAFGLLVRDARSLEILHDKGHREVGAATVGTDGGSPYFWGVLFSSGGANGSFSFEGGAPKPNRPGCYSGANDDCSAAAVRAPAGRGLLAAVSAGVLFVLAYL
ncbi:uncharacterized protein M6B38_169320 [Iris pallida]|uniref:Ferredoxin-like protein n=1 Tax=Iris pallida TaxID=29817 RepID=A0AAX6EVB8_IRIPA|nr:uncharacterized protein M6B38_169320 [Iris pallida]